MPITYATDHAKLERALLAWVETYAGLSAGSGRWLNQVMNRPDLPYATLQIISEGMLEGQDGEYREYNAATTHLDTVLYGPRRMTVQVTVYTAMEVNAEHNNARKRLTGAVASLRIGASKVALSTAGLSFLQQLVAIIATDEQLGQRWERRAQVDLEFGYTSLVTDKPLVGDTENWIETVDPITEDAGSITVTEY